MFLLKNIDCGYSLEPPWRRDSNVYLQFMFSSKKKKKKKKKKIKIMDTPVNPVLLNKSRV